MARASLQILADLACFAPRLAPNIVNDIVDSSCQVILSQKATEAIMVEAYLCVMSWLVGANVPSAWITEKTQDKIVNAIKVGKLYGSVPQDSIAVTIGAATGGGAGSGDSAGSGSGGSGSGGSSNGGNGTSSPSTIVIGSSANGMSSSSSSSSLSSSGIGMGSVGGNGGGGDSSSMGGGSGGAGSSLTGSSGAQGQYSQPQSRRERVAERSKTLRRLKKSDPFGGRGSIGFSDRDRDDDDNSSSGGFSSSGGCGVGSGIGGIGGGGGGSIGGGVGACGSSVSPGPGGSSGAGGAGATGTVGAGMVISSGGISGVGGNSPRVGVRYAAEMLLECMLSFRGSYPFAEGPDVMGSLISEGDDGAREEHTTSFVYNKTNIISVADIPLNPTHIVYNAKTAVAPTGTTAARVIIREASGKWAWDFIPLHAPAETGLPEADLEFESGGAGDDDQQQQTSSGGRTGARREKTMMGQSFMLKQNNKLFDALLATEEANPELPTMINSTQVLDKFAGKVEETEALVAGLGAAEATVKTLYPSPLRECEPTPPEAAPAMTENTATRLLLQQLGFTSPVSAVAPLVERVQLGEKYKRSNAMFDKSPTRGVHKIGLIYVREGQETQNVILANSAGSPLYRDFVRGLGWTIDVTEHRGYLGGLDKSSSAGRTAVYWADALTEVIFHEVVAMPTSDTDHQQIHKKRHVGNDFVHVIWCEGLRDYDPLTITSQFNEAHIVIYPQEDGLCRVQVFRDLQNNIFGPLQHGMVVSKDILPALVRQTAINADNAITSRITPDPFKRPYATKRKMLNESVDRYVDTDFSYTKSVAEIIKGDLVEDPPQSGSSPSSSPASSSSQQLSASSSSSSSTSALPDPTQR